VLIFNFYSIKGNNMSDLKYAVNLGFNCPALIERVGQQSTLILPATICGLMIPQFWNAKDTFIFGEHLNSLWGECTNTGSGRYMTASFDDPAKAAEEAIFSLREVIRNLSNECLIRLSYDFWGKDWFFGERVPYYNNGIKLDFNY